MIDRDKIQKRYGYPEYFTTGNMYITSGGNKTWISITISGSVSIAIHPSQ